jgi:hypothetical protein
MFFTRFYPLIIPFICRLLHRASGTLRKVSPGGEARQAIRRLLPHAQKYQPATNQAQQVYRFAPLRLAALIIRK